MAFKGCFLIAAVVTRTHGLNNGVALTPPMGYNTYMGHNTIMEAANFFVEKVKKLWCTIHLPKPPLLANHHRVAASILTHVSLPCVPTARTKGLIHSGYEFVNSDEGWEEKQRDNVTGKIVPSAAFGGSDAGITAMIATVHKMGLKMGPSSLCGCFRWQRR